MLLDSPRISIVNSKTRHIRYDTKSVTVVLDRPDTPRIARALTLLTDELNNTPAGLPGDRRPITHHVRPA